MRVRMRVNITGTRDGQDWPRIGDTLDVPDLEGAELCANGMAEPVPVAAPVETATRKGQARKAVVTRGDA